MSQNTHRVRSRKALIIAERAVDRIVLSRFVALAGIAVMEAEPASALAALRNGAPDILVIDAGPTNDSHNAFIEAFAAGDRPEILVVASEARAAQILNGDPGIDAAICKPLTTDKVVPAVRDLLDARASR